MRIRSHRSRTLWIAFALHRFSGIVLALFLPVHFWTLSWALNRPDDLDRLLQWYDQPAVKIVEFGLVFLLAVHMFGGLRLLALEFLPWTDRHKTLAVLAVCLAFLVGGIFLLRAF